MKQKQNNKNKQTKNPKGIAYVELKSYGICLSLSDLLPLA